MTHPTSPPPAQIPATPEGEATAQEQDMDCARKILNFAAESLFELKYTSFLVSFGVTDKCRSAKVIAAHVRSAVEAKTKELEAENASLADLIHKAIDTLDGNEEPIAWREGGPELLRKLSESLEARRDTLSKGQADKGEE